MRSPPQSSPALPLQRLAQLAVLAALIAAVIWAWSTGRVADLSVDQIRQTIHAAGVLGPIIYVLAFGLLQPVGVSAHLFILAAAVIWPPAPAAAIAWGGMMLAAIVSFVLSRYLARDLIEGFIPERMRRWDEALEQRGFVTVLGLRLVFFTTFAVQMMFGLTRVRWRDYLAATAIGNLPVLLLEIMFADVILRWMGA